MSPPIDVVPSELSNIFHFENGYFHNQTSRGYVLVDNISRVLGEIDDVDLPFDEVFVERTNAAFDSVSEDNGEWLSAEDFLKELETW